MLGVLLYETTAALLVTVVMVDETFLIMFKTQFH